MGEPRYNHSEFRQRVTDAAGDPGAFPISSDLADALTSGEMGVEQSIAQIVIAVFRLETELTQLRDLVGEPVDPGVEDD